MSGEVTKDISQEDLWGGGRSPFSMSYGKMMMWFFLVSDALTFGALLTSLGFARQKYVDVWPKAEEVFHAFPFMEHTYLPLLYVALMTFILIISSVTMVLAVEAGHRLDKKGVQFWLGLTVVGGLFFVLSQVWEWGHFIHGTDHGVYSYIDGTRGNIIEMDGEDKHIITEWKEGALFEVKRGHEVIATLSGAEGQAKLEAGHHIHGANLVENEYGPQQYADFFFFITGFHGFHVSSGIVINLIILLGVAKGIYHKRGHYEMVEKTGLYWHFVDLVWVFVFTAFYLL